MDWFYPHLHSLLLVVNRPIAQILVVVWDSDSELEAAVQNLFKHCYYYLLQIKFYLLLLGTLFYLFLIFFSHGPTLLARGEKNGFSRWCGLDSGDLGQDICCRSDMVPSILQTKQTTAHAWYAVCTSNVLPYPVLHGHLRHRCSGSLS